MNQHAHTHLKLSDHGLFGVDHESRSLQHPSKHLPTKVETFTEQEEEGGEGRRVLFKVVCH